MPTKRTRSTALTLVAVLLLGVGLAACGGGGDDEADTTTTTDAPETTTTTAVAFDPGGSDTTDTTSDGGDDQQEAIDDFMSSVQSDTGAASGEAYTYTSVSDDTGQLTVDAPAEWSDVDGAINENFTPPIPDVRASTDLDAYNSNYTVPGFQFTATANSTTGDPDAVMDEFAARTGQDCDSQGRQPYVDPLYTGVSEIFTTCGGDPNASFVWTVVEPIDTSDGDYVATVGVQILSDADIEALGHILETFVVTPA